MIECIFYCLLQLESQVKCKMHPKSTPAKSSLLFLLVLMVFSGFGASQDTEIPLLGRTDPTPAKSRLFAGQKRQKARSVWPCQVDFYWKNMALWLPFDPFPFLWVKNSNPGAARVDLTEVQQVAQLAPVEGELLAVVSRKGGME